VTFAFRCAECSRRAELKREYPELEDEDIRQALAFAAALVDHKVLPPAADTKKLLLDQGLPRSTVLHLLNQHQRINRILSELIWNFGLSKVLAITV